jgi:DNA-binding response OmpR family regulator
MISNYSDKEKFHNVIPLNITQYLIKPINYADITTALSNMMERLYENGMIDVKITDTLSYNYINNILKDDTTILPLSKKEILLLKLFLKHKNSLITYSMIEYALDDFEISNQSIKNIIHRLRQKVGKKTIVNIKEMGYMIAIKG